ncbi:ABC transporter permease [Nonomuraea sp. MCN248]|uniref:ABC transporter permease n=1 Tax=Nonomuraea corallina TaxID=2989783 RepID=A0ABT4S8N3_9ACTN|nr:ABC transporter permease [Nonomuraea corallina]MDA0633285.1 ABC transporter permease [Nonomuraea corallina]
MLRYVGRRVAGLALVLLIVLTLVFFMLRAAPGGSAEAYLGMNPTPEKVAEVERRLGLDQPIWVQYGTFVGNLLTGDFGRSLFSDRPVIDIIAERLPVTLELSLIAFVFWVAVGLYVKGVLPSSGWVHFGDDPVENLRTVILPAFALGLGSGAIIARTLPASMIDIAQADYVSFARAMGMPERHILRRITARNAIIPTATVIGLTATPSRRRTASSRS